MRRRANFSGIPLGDTLSCGIGHDLFFLLSSSRGTARSRALSGLNTGGKQNDDRPLKVQLYLKGDGAVSPPSAVVRRVVQETEKMTLGVNSLEQHFIVVIP